VIILTSYGLDSKHLKANDSSAECRMPLLVEGKTLTCIPPDFKQFVDSCPVVKVCVYFQKMLS